MVRKQDSWDWKTVADGPSGSNKLVGLTIL